MPRIPSVSEVRSVSAAVTRDPGVRATAEDFGLAAARGLANLGIGVGNFGQGLKQFIEEPENGEDPGGKTEDKKAEGDGVDKDSGAIPSAGDPGELASTIGNTMAWDDVAASKHHIAWVREQSRLLIEKQQHQGGSPIETAEQSQKGLEASAEEHLNELPQQQRDRAKEAAKPVVAGHALSAVQRSQNLKVEALAQKTAETLELLTGQAAADPASAEKFLADGLDLLSQSHRTGALSDAQLEQRSTSFRRDLYATMLREQKASDVVADLEAGIYDAALDDPELKQLLLIEHRWRMQGEEAQGRANGEAMVAGAAQGDEAQPTLNDATQAILTAGDFADFELEVEKARRVRSGVESLRFAPEDEFEAEIAKLAPAVEVLDQEARLEIQEAVRRGGERLLEERRADPADYAMGLPSVAKAFEAAKADPSLLPSAVRGRLAAQAAMGIGPEDQRALSKSEVAEILQGYQALSEDARAGAVEALRKVYGDDIGRVAAELEEAGLPAQMVQALDLSGKGAMVRRATGELDPPGAVDGGIIQETADRLLAEGSERSVPPRPGRKPVPSPEVLRAIGGDSPVANTGGTPPFPHRKSGSGPHPSEEKLLNKYHTLLEEDYDRLIDGFDAAEVESFEQTILQAAEAIGASPELADLARRLVVRNLRDGFPLSDAVALALDEAEIQRLNRRDGNDELPQGLGASDPQESLDKTDSSSEIGAVDPDFVTQGTTRKLDEELAVLGIGPVLRGEIASAEQANLVRSLIHRIMQARADVASDGDQVRGKLHKDIEILNNTEQRFLVKQLQRKLNRAFDRPETVPWALTDAELHSVYRSLGRSVGEANLAADVAGAAAVANPITVLVAAAAKLGGVQQSSLRQQYETELYRRGIFRWPKPDSNVRRSPQSNL